MDDPVDVLVVGAGPAGSAAAITAARAGLRVVMCDKAPPGRDKTCGDGLTTDALRRVERLGLDPARVRSWTPVHDVVLRSPSGRLVEVPLPRTGGLFAAVAPRAALDAALVDLAAQAGADVRFDVAVEGFSATRGGMRATCSSGVDVSARWVVAADGVYSTVRRLIDPRPAPYLGEWHAFRQYWRGVPDERLWVLFEPDLLPGYAWVFPLGNGRANVGFGIRRRDGESVRPMAQLWRELVERPSLRSVLGAAGEPEGPHRAWPIPADLRRAPLALGRVLFTGDAAGATDPLTGEGIAQALHTGVLAAECIGAGGPVAGRYTTAVHAQLGRDLRFAGALGEILSHRQGARAAIRVAGLAPWTRSNFGRWLFEDYPRALALTPGRWRRDVFTARGAYQAGDIPLPA